MLINKLTFIFIFTVFVQTELTLISCIFLHLQKSEVVIPRLEYWRLNYIYFDEPKPTASKVIMKVTTHCSYPPLR